MHSPHTSVREVLRQHPEVKRGGWKQLPVPEQWKFVFPACRNIRRFVIDRTYSVQTYQIETPWGQVEHLVIRRHDEAPVRSWTDLQRIKDEIAGPGRLAIEVFPPRGDLVDQANNYHLWVLPEGFDLPFGLHMPGGGM